MNSNIDYTALAYGVVEEYGRDQYSLRAWHPHGLSVVWVPNPALSSVRVFPAIKFRYLRLLENVTCIDLTFVSFGDVNTGT